MNVSYSLLLILILFFSGCSDKAEKQPWWNTIPSDSPVVILHHDADFFNVLEERRTGMLSELAQIQVDELHDIKARADIPLAAKATALFPTGSHQLQPVFILEDPGAGISAMASPFRKAYAVNEYRFQNRNIHILYVGSQELYATQFHDWIVMSKNSAAIENSILTYLGENPTISITPDDLTGGSYLINTPALNNWLKVLGAPRYLPRFTSLFDGTEPAVFTVSDEGFENPLYDITLKGRISLSREGRSEFLSTFSSEPADFDLDQYIPTDAAMFAVYHDEPSRLHNPEIPLATPLDSLLAEDSELYERIVRTFAPPSAFVAFEASGFLSVGEHMFLRRLENASGFNDILRELARNGHIEESNNVYFVNSNVLARMLGGYPGRFTDFYVMRSANAAIVTKRAGLARRIDQDRRRRSVFYYDDEYMNSRQNHPSAVSTWLYVRSSPLASYLEPKLNPVNHAGFLATLMDVGAMSLVNDGEGLVVQLDSYFSEDRSEPVRDIWAFDLGGSRITGKPLLANIGGGSRDELIAATENNRVIGVASDGTGFLDVQTGSDQPIGSPVVYDWYGNYQNAVLIAAGNKIYAWNTRGIPLPNFPITMEESITAPLAVADVSRNGNPEMIVATADRRIHVLDQRGRNIQGWPQDLNTRVSQKPIFREFQGESSLWITAGNGLFAFTSRGARRGNYPVFIESDLGPITFHDNHILAGASDGHLYAIGREAFFADSLIVRTENANGGAQNAAGLNVRRVYVGNAPVINAPIVQTLTLAQNDEQIREQMIGVQTLDGNLFLLNEAGQLRMSRNMGQAAADYDNMLLTDLNGDGKTDMIGVASTGRMYAWQVESGESVPDIPTASMRYPLIADIFNNGERELVGQTRDGLRCWSFRRP